MDRAYLWYTDEKGVSIQFWKCHKDPEATSPVI